MLKIEKCTIKTFDCLDTLLSWNDFKILAEARTIERLEIENILDTDGRKVPIEDICDYVPNLNYLFSNRTHVTTKTMQKICKSLISTNMERFSMNSVDGLLNAEDYLEFIKIRPNAWFSVFFSSVVSDDQETLFKTVVKSEIKKWPEQKPRFH
uniref:DUF38 domain-containing protein n=1 Tax=Panagrolaimus sp. PS1159 TaxID=55785 RepID=A0AC35FLR2_9BILA